jgi:type III restriction enzyme
VDGDERPHQEADIEALNDRSHAYRRVLDARFAGRVRVFDVEDFADIR